MNHKEKIKKMKNGIMVDFMIHMEKMHGDMNQNHIHMIWIKKIQEIKEIIAIDEKKKRILEAMILLQEMKTDMIK